MGKKKQNRIGKIPTFVKKLTEILDDPNAQEFIFWLPDGNGFQIVNVSGFADNVLPKHFKHNNMASFVRQLNMYGFNRPIDSHQHVYTHSRFQRGNYNNMKFIKRKGNHFRNTDEESSEEENAREEHSRNSNKNFLKDEYDRILAENEALKKQNQELLKKEKQFQEIRRKLKSWGEQMTKFTQLLEQNENKETEKQTSSSNASSDSVSSNTNNHFSSKSGFSICNSKFSAKQEESYQILLQGCAKNGEAAQKN